jgi:signal transduction histidine kinase
MIMIGQNQPAMRTRWFLIVWCAWFPAGVNWVRAQVLSNALQVRSLSTEQAARSLAVQFEAVVTYYNGWTRGDLIVQDDTDGIYVETRGWVLDLNVGDRVLIKGNTSPGDFAPVIKLAAITVIRQEKPGAARPITVEEFLSGREDCRQVQLRGIVRAARIDSALEPPRLILDIASAGNRFSAYVLRYSPGDASRLVDAAVGVRGVGLPYTNRRRQAFNVRLMVNDSAEIEIERPAAEDPFGLPLQPLGALLQFSPGGSSQHRVHVRGVVTHHEIGEGIYIQEQDRGLFLRTAEKKSLRPGEYLDVVGFAAMGDYNPILEDVVWRVQGQRAVPPAELLSAESLLNGNYDGQLVSIRASLRDRLRRPGQEILLLQAGSTLCQAQIRVGDNEAASFHIGSELQLTGVCTVHLGQQGRFVFGGKPESFRLLLRGVEDVVVLARPSWWTLPRVRLILGLVSATFLVAVLWGLMLARKNRLLHEHIAARGRAEQALQQAHDELEIRVEERSRALEEQIGARREAEADFQAVLRERNRLATELHDTLEQGLTGIALQLEAASATSASSAGPSLKHVEMARVLVRQSQSEVRRSVWDLKSQVLEQRGLAGAFEEIARQLTEGTSIAAKVEAKGTAVRLPDTMENNLWRIGQEAVTNALKHAAPRTIEIKIEYSASQVVLTVRDDGRGFEVAEQWKSGGGHFGLMGMRERAKRIGGRLEIESSPGRGASISIIVIRNQAAALEIQKG